MDVISFLQEENTRLRNLIWTLITNYKTSTRDEVFDSVREICDGIVNHLDKQRHVLLEKLNASSCPEDLMQRLATERSGVSDEIGRLVEVHVDEPEYVECLTAVLRELDEHAAISDEFYRHVATTVKGPEWDAINESFKSHLFQSGMSLETMTTTQGIQDISLNDR